ncbi:hypothetical protein ABW20_dc0103551 [Dactylellina cionopaga]|nr:hypothetical protein ABW20_dc0103551 [Dactylellina cionopaga]
MTVAAPPPSLSAILSTLTTSLTSTKNSLPSAPLSQSAAAGISLLDLKNDVFLSYLHHLSYLLLFRIRNRSLNPTEGEEGGGSHIVSDELVKTLAGLRLWLEKGVKPCENKLKYQIEKALKAASEWEREQARKEKEKELKGDSDEEGSVSENDDDGDGDEDEEGADSDEEITSEESADEQLRPQNLNYDSDDLSSNRPAKASTTITMKNALAYRPNPSLLAKPASASLPFSGSKDGSKDGIYRPPKLNPVSMPLQPTVNDADPDAPRGGRATKEKSQKSRVIDDFIASMPHSAPVAEPSIGSNVGRLGRTKTAREREVERERREYEESNFVRLPGMSKKEKREKARSNGKEWGGEDWRSLERGMGLDRIDRLTRKKREGGGGAGLLERSRKRGAADGDGDVRIGERFDKRRKTVERERRRSKK